jgi:hypothetical protein
MIEPMFFQGFEGARACPNRDRPDGAGEIEAQWS